MSETPAWGTPPEEPEHVRIIGRRSAAGVAWTAMRETALHALRVGTRTSTPRPSALHRDHPPLARPAVGVVVPGRTKSVALSPSGRFLATISQGLEGTAIRVWDLYMGFPVWAA